MLRKRSQRRCNPARADITTSSTASSNPRAAFRWVRATGQTLFEGGGEQATERRAVRFTGVVTETTEQKELGEALRRSEAEYRTLFETMTQAVVYQDASGEIISANPAAHEILGLSKAMR